MHFLHWNVTGSRFNSLHAVFQEQYSEPGTAVDDIAKRIRALGFVVPGSYQAFAELISIPATKGVPDALEMGRQLIEGQETVVCIARECFHLHRGCSRRATGRLIAGADAGTQKTAWVLRSTTG